MIVTLGFGLLLVSGRSLEINWHATQQGAVKTKPANAEVCSHTTLRQVPQRNQIMQCRWDGWEYLVVATLQVDIWVRCHVAVDTTCQCTCMQRQRIKTRYIRSARTQ